MQGWCRHRHGQSVCLTFHLSLTQTAANLHRLLRLTGEQETTDPSDRQMQRQTDGTGGTASDRHGPHIQNIMRYGPGGHVTQSARLDQRRNRERRTGLQFTVIEQTDQC